MGGGGGGGPKRHNDRYKAAQNNKFATDKLEAARLGPPTGTNTEAEGTTTRQLDGAIGKGEEELRSLPAASA